MDYQLQDQTLIFHFEGDFDNVAVGKVKETCAALIETHRPKLVKLDFQKVDFVDFASLEPVVNAIPKQ